MIVIKQNENPLSLAAFNLAPTGGTTWEFPESLTQSRVLRLDQPRLEQSGHFRWAGYKVMK